MLSGHSFNALLKTLEEPPPHVKFVLATTDPQKLPITILSRCLRFNLTRLLPDQISDYLGKILQAESVESEDTAILRIARAADGSMRDGLSLLDQAIAFGGGSLKDAEVASMLGSIDHAHVAALIDALINADAKALLEKVDELCLQSRNLESVLDEMAEAMHRIALLHAAPGFRDPERADWESLAERAENISPEDAQLYYQIAITGRRDIGLAPDPRTGLEMTLLRMLAFRPAESLQGSVPGSAPAAAKGTAVKTASAPVHAVKTKPADVKGDAAKAARAAFDAMTSVKQVAQAELMTSGIPQGEPMDLLLEPEADHAIATDLQGQESETDWNSLQSSLKLSGAARELARNLELESTESDRWRFLVPDTLRHLGSESVIQSLQTALSERLGHAVMLDLHTATEPLQSVAAATEAAEVIRMSEAERAIEEDPTVQQIKEKFGAKIIPDTIQPMQ